MPGHVDGDELAVRAVLGQQVTVAAARTAAARLTLALRHAAPARRPACRRAGLTHLFPTGQRLAELDPESLPMPRARGRALVALCRALADGDVRLDRGADRDAVRAALLEIPGIGPWTADYIALRALGHPDVFLPTTSASATPCGVSGATPPRPPRLAAGWSPWRSYAQLHLWHTLTHRWRESHRDRRPRERTLTCGP